MFSPQGVKNSCNLRQLKPRNILKQVSSNIETKHQCCSAGGAGNDKVWLCYGYTLFELRQHCVAALQLTCHAQCFVAVTEKRTAGMITPDGLMTVTMLFKVTCLSTESNQ